MPDHLAIAQVTPYAWEAENEVNRYIARVSAELAGLGHRILIMAPSNSSALVSETRRSLRDDPAGVLERAASGPVVLGVGEVLSFAPTRRRAPSLPIDVARTIEEQTAKLPSDLFLWAAGASILGSLALKATGRDHESLFVGQWAPTFLILGLYNKIVKVAGSDAYRG